MSAPDWPAPITDRLDGSGDLGGRTVTAIAVLLAFLLVVPLAWLFIQTATLGDQIPALLTSATTLAVLGRSVALVAAVTGASILVGVPLAVLTVQSNLPFKRFWTVAAALPLAVPSYLGAFAFISAFGPRGAFVDLLAPLGIEKIPSVFGFWGAVFVLTIYTYPYVFLTTRASLLSLDASLVEAARTLNAGRFEAFRRVTLPQIAPGIAAGALLVALYALADFGTPAFMRVQVFTQFIYSRFDAFQQGYAALLSLQLLAVTAVVLFLESRIGADDDGAYESRGNRGKFGFDLGVFRYPDMLLPAGIGLLAVGLPIGIFTAWLFRPGTGLASDGMAFEWAFAANSVQVAVLAAVASLVVALPIGLRGANADSRLSRLAERAPYVGYATPGIVLALALLWFTLDVAPVVYRNYGIPLLVFAYVVRFSSQAVGSIRTSVLQVDSRLHEAARTLGRSRLQTFRAVTLPLIVPGVATGAALVFLTTMKELPATLMLRPLGFETLVTHIWSVRETGAYGQAAIPALVLVVISALSMGVILHQEQRT